MPGKSFAQELLEDPNLPDMPAHAIVQGITAMSEVSTKATLEEAEKIWPLLKRSLPIEVGHGLTAIQIGVPKRIAYIQYNGKEYRLLNTEIVEKSKPFIMGREGCLSLKAKIVNTERFENIIIQDDVLGKVSLDVSADGLLPVIIQHEVDHFNGKTILDRRQKPIRKDAKIGRNESCPCASGKKYKKCCGK